MSYPHFNIYWSVPTWPVDSLLLYYLFSVHKYNFPWTVCSFYFLKFLLEYGFFTMLCFCCTVNHLCVYIYPPFCGFLSHLGHHRGLDRVPCAIQSVIIISEYCVYVNPSLPIHPSLSFLSWCPRVWPLHLCHCFCFAKRFICTIFLDSAYMH